MATAPGGNETQDSQAILDALKAELGVGPALSGSPVPDHFDAGDDEARTAGEEPSPGTNLTGRAVHAQRAAGAAPDKAPLQIPAQVCGAATPAADKDGTDKSFVKQTTRHQAPRHARGGSAAHHSGRTAAETTAAPGGPDLLRNHGNDAARIPDTFPHDARTLQNNAAQQPLKSNQAQSANGRPSAPRKAMEASQQTPTQVNEDRDYGDDFGDPLPSSPVDPNARDERTLQPDDTGAVNFGDLGELARPSSQVSEDAGFDNTRGEWRVPENATQHPSSHAFTPYKPHGVAPETPALPKNPFATKPGAGVPFGGTQMFGQTQFSSAVKKISPTSSRPSPHLFYNSISPNITETSPLKNRANVSSPTDIRTSSPQRLHDIPATVERPRRHSPVPPEETPSNNKSTEDEKVPESPSSRNQRLSESREPLTHYEPMRISQERKAHEGVPPASLATEESDSDDAIKQMNRRKRIEKKRARAAQEMERVSFTPSIRESDEPSARKKRKLSGDAEGNTVQRATSGDAYKTTIEEPCSDLRSSLKATATPNDVVVVSSEGEPTKAADEAEMMDATKADVEMETEKPIDEDMIPDTSPVRSPSGDDPRDIPPASEPEPPTLGSDAAELLQGDGAKESSSLPPPRLQLRTTYSKSSRKTRSRAVVSSSTSDILHVNGEVSSIRQSSPTSTPDDGLAPNQQEHGTTRSPQIPQPAPSVPAFTQTRKIGRGPLTPLQARVNDAAADASSSLTILSVTPQPSSKTTPGTQESPAPKRTEQIDFSSSAGTRKLRKRSLRTGARSESPPSELRFRRSANRSPRLDSESTDELHQAPSASALSASTTQFKASRNFRQALAPIQRATRLFEGMAFALSFESGQAKQQDRARLETKISHAGGLILSEGFQELFERPASMAAGKHVAAKPVLDEDGSLKLTRAGTEVGFTALIADSHSRKAKYMQALALGLPCLAPQWITACLNKEAILDWEPYLLCAGSSAVLGGAIRSRGLPTYPADEASLADAVEGRGRLLEGQRVLIVVDSKRSRNEAKQPYIFLAQALGPFVSRVFTTQQAGEAIRQHEKTGSPFDWLYVDKGTATVESVLAEAEATAKKSRKKPASTARVVKQMRILNDELVIQSLILGRMVDEEEMNC